MNNDLELARIGKRMPYTTPAGFADRMEEQVWQRLQAADLLSSSPLPRAATPTWRPRWHRVAALTAVAAGVLCLLTFHYTARRPVTNDMACVEQAFSRLTPEDQRFLIDLYQEEDYMRQ